MFPRHLRPVARPLRSVRAFHPAPPALSGHNKWSKIKNQKGANDAKKGEVYSQAYRQIVLAARNGGSLDPEVNGALAAAIRAAKTSGVPKDNIEKALAKAAGGGERGAQQLVFECMGPGSVGIIVESMSDNPNRTFKFLNELMKDNGGRKSEVKYLFKHEGQVEASILAEEGVSADARLEMAVETAFDFGAHDFVSEDSPDEGATVTFSCPPSELHRMTSALAESNAVRQVLRSELVYAPVDPMEELDDETGERLAKLVAALESEGDTLRVYTTADS